MQPRIFRTIAALSSIVVAAPLAAQSAPPLGSVAALSPVGVVQRDGQWSPITPADTDSTGRAMDRGSARRDTTGRLRTVYTPGERFMMRSVVGTLGWVGGAFIGAYAGVTLFGTDCGGCDDPGLDHAIAAAAVGAVLGTTLAVSATGFGDRCNGANRAMLTALGAAAGTAIGAFIGFSEYSGGHPFILIPIVGGVGGASGAALCTAEGSAHRRR